VHRSSLLPCYLSVPWPRLDLGPSYSRVPVHHSMQVNSWRACMYLLAQVYYKVFINKRWMWGHIRVGAVFTVQKCIRCRTRMMEKILCGNIWNVEQFYGGEDFYCGFLDYVTVCTRPACSLLSETLVNTYQATKCHSPDTPMSVVHFHRTWSMRLVLCALFLKKSVCRNNPSYSRNFKGRTWIFINFCLSTSCGDKSNCPEGNWILCC